MYLLTFRVHVMLS